MIYSYLQGGADLQTVLTMLLLTLPIVLLALCLHETAHGYVAYKLGDPTARSLGRLTLNPLKHIDPIGFLCMLGFGFGWAKPVPINTRYFKKPKRDMAICGLAGPVSNLLLCIIFAALLRIFSEVIASVPFASEQSAYLASLIYTFLYLGIRLNVGLAVFNLLPIPPLDGSRLLTALLPWRISAKLIQYEQIIAILLMVALWFGVLDPVLDFVTGGILNVVYTLFGL